MPDSYVRRFIPGKAIDGDTIETDLIDLGFHTSATGIRFRILGVDCPESNRSATKTAGLAAKAYTVAWLTEHAAHDPGGWLYAATTKTDSFGRYLAVVTCGLSHDLSDALLESGHAVPYPRKD